MQQDPHPGNTSDPVTLINRYSYAGNNPIAYNDPSGMIFGIDDPLFIGIMALAGAVANGIQNGFSLQSVLQGAILGASLGAGVIGFSSVIGAGVGATNGSGASGLAGSTGVVGAVLGLANPGLGASIAAGLLAIPAGVAMFDGKRTWADGYANAYLTVGSIGGLARAALFTIALPTVDADSILKVGQVGLSQKGNFLINRDLFDFFNDTIWNVRGRLFGIGAAPLIGVR